MSIHKLLLGTYTKRTSKGVYEVELDTQSQQLQNATLVFELTNPTYLALSKANKVYAVENRDGQGGVVTLDNTQRPMVELDAQLSDGSAPAYIGVDEARQLVFAGYYHRGLVEVYKIQADGRLQLADSFQNEGSGPRPEQSAAHIHFCNLTPDNRLVAVDLGADQVITFDVSDDGQLTELNRYQTDAGFGPRHIRFSPDGQYAYLLGELSSLLSVLKYNQEDGSFEHLMTTSTIPDDWTEHNGAAAIRVSADGRFIYTSNRGHDSVSVFECTNLGAEIELIQLISTEGSFPRDMALDPSENYLVVANQETDNLSLYARDEQTGELSLLQKGFTLPEGVRVTFEN
ncbi:lactonase family protein [Convivina intestini]|uniref:6-phosphogluconolactonase n=1 Tax=Convivina intestini TaxID=1505726 RepID=A0A2U1DBZ9_9LACO|nr:lactonase family protein [Convivina intestini]PVY85215.1 6-phosphogluconolactonase [Convivina intestini]CAH1852457.1 6-phosphogluconolactonase [Convivina intestini]CAH1854593.1 6-phosphogluconolactonase [Convivina intestini]SDC00997.1 6-phosphogluconolactonase [Leuconostocaceae bacterium R-53105]